MYICGMITKSRCRLALLTLLAGLLVACKKNSSSSFNNTAAFTANVQTQTSDQVRISNTIDAVFNDVDSVLANPVNLCAANVSVDSVADTITIAYNGTSCGLLSYSGTVRIGYTPGNSWNNALDTVGIRFYNVIINTPPDTNHILFTGYCYYTNVSGGSLSGLNNGSPPVIHSITGVNLSVVYNYTWQSYWQIARQRSYTNNSGMVIVTTSGMDSVGGFAAVSEWGGSRFGNSVIVSVDSPLVINQGCGWRLTGGQIQLHNPAGTTSMIYGLDSTGAATGCPLAGTPYFYKLAWSGTGQNPYTAILPYP